MTDAQVAEGATVETSPTPPVEAGFSLPEGQGNGTAETTAPERDYEAEARDMGWVPEAEFKGDKKPAKFLDAKEFVERGETVLPFVKRENTRLKEELKKRDEDYAQRFERLTKATEATLKKQREDHQRELESLKVQREAAVQAGDVQKFRSLDKQISDHQANAPEPEAPKQEKAPQNEDLAAVEAAWIKDNSWYTTNETLQQYAFWYSNQIKRPDLSMAENLRLTTEAVKQKFPMEFGRTGANAHAPVDGGGDPKPPTPQSKTPTFDKLPAEAKAFARGAKERGEWKGTLEEWAKAYNS